MLIIPFNKSTITSHYHLTTHTPYLRYQINLPNPTGVYFPLQIPHLDLITPDHTHTTFAIKSNNLPNSTITNFQLTIPHLHLSIA